MMTNTFLAVKKVLVIKKKIELLIEFILILNSNRL